MLETRMSSCLTKAGPDQVQAAQAVRFPDFESCGSKVAVERGVRTIERGRMFQLAGVRRNRREDTQAQRKPAAVAEPVRNSHRLLEACLGGGEVAELPLRESRGDTQHAAYQRI